MKNIILIGLCVLSTMRALHAQSPVSWKYTVEKVNDTVYKVHFTATIDDGWHIFTQHQPKDGIGLPTQISFNKNPILALVGTPQEHGDLEIDSRVGENYQYRNKVDFIQVIKKRATVKANISGTIHFQTCTDEQCLFPEPVSFSVSI